MSKSDAAQRLRALRKKSTATTVPSKKQKRRPRHHYGCNCNDCKEFRNDTPRDVDRHVNGSRDTDTDNTSGDEPKPDVRQADPAKRTDTGGARAKPAKKTSTRKVGSVKNPPAPDLPVAEGIPIYDPKNPGVIFDGKVMVYSTCRDCGELMQVVYATEYVHPCCTPKPTKVETLAQGWLSCIKNDDLESARLTKAELDQIDSRPPDLKAAALEYVSWGWPVFPLQPHSKEPATSNGFKDATTKPNWIEKWWERNPQYNIGLATGAKFDALDVDPRDGGIASFNNLLDANRIPPTHAVATTASGGIHLYFTPTGKGNRAGWMPGLDYRGRGGYVVAPPSTLGERGRSWSWLCVPSPKLREEEF